jgi:hypothetical protein
VSWRPSLLRCAEASADGFGAQSVRRAPISVHTLDFLCGFELNFGTCGSPGQCPNERAWREEPLSWLSSQKITPLFDAGYLTLGIAFVFVEAPL